MHKSAIHLVGLLNQYRRTRNRTVTGSTSVPLSQCSEHIHTQLESVVSGPQVALLFATEAVRVLSQFQLCHLFRFLQDLATPVSIVKEISNKKAQEHFLTTLISDFHSKEVILSKKSPKRLAIPGGQPDAHIGLILHVRSEEMEEEALPIFWDPLSRTINLLQQKGMSDEFVFGYDWHWRADDSFQRNSGCPAVRWDPQLRALHDRLSVDILANLHLHFVITASAYTRDNFRK